ncbi:MAG: hypothetical protein WBX38_15600 [Candidatus Sulfotelmatobacter sp.]
MSTVGMSGWFYLNRSHALADRVDNLVGDLLGFFRTRLGSIKAGVQNAESALRTGAMFSRFDSLTASLLARLYGFSLLLWFHSFQSTVHLTELQEAT